MQPLISICCAWYNRARFINQTLDSLTRQDIEEIEIIIVNDGSSDPHVKYIIDQYSDSRIKKIQQENIGFTRSINNAIKHARAPFVAIQGAGDISLPSRLRKQYNYLRDNENVGAVGCSHLEISARSGNKIGSRIAKNNSTIDNLRYDVPFTHGSVMYRKAVIEKVGYYDAFFEYCQDWDLYFRIIENKEIHGLEEFLYEKYIFEDGVTFSAQTKFSQFVFRKLARDQDRAEIDRLKSNRHELEKLRDASSPKNLISSMKMLLIFIRKREFGIAFGWFKLIVSQFKNLWKTFLTHNRF